MYYRRKILISILKSFGGELDKTDLQNLLLIFTQQQKKPGYYFIPYENGCCSFQANADLNTLQKYKITNSDNNNWYLLNQDDPEIELLKEDHEILKTINNQFKNKLGDELLKYTYTHFPYYAINSRILNKILDKANAEIVLKLKPGTEATGLYTIGYEGISLEEYLNKLIKYDIKVLCDVRRNPLSMKYGFSKNQLKSACENLRIQYKHFPELGIKSEDRRNVSTQNDIDLLFKSYLENTIPETIDSQENLIELIKEHKRTAITCFEADINKCHRLHLANSLKKLDSFTYKVYHI